MAKSVTREQYDAMVARETAQYEIERLRAENARLRLSLDQCFASLQAAHKLLTREE